MRGICQECEGNGCKSHVNLTCHTCKGAGFITYPTIYIESYKGGLTPVIPVDVYSSDKWAYGERGSKDTYLISKHAFVYKVGSKRVRGVPLSDFAAIVRYRELR